MEELREAFLIESISKLNNLQDVLQSAELSPGFQREIFRALHTIKGTSQTFGLNAAARLAHEIENLLEAARDSQIRSDEKTISLLSEGLKHLSDALESAGEGDFSQEFAGKIRQIAKIDFPAPKDFPAQKIPPEFLTQLSSHEQNQIAAALEGGKNLFLIEVGFEFASFDEDFKNLKNILSETGDAAAAFPSRKFTDKIGFQIFFAAAIQPDAAARLVEPFGADIIFHLAKPETAFPANPQGVLQQAVEGGKETARRLGKNVEFDVSFDETKVSVKLLKTFADVLLHLIRNAVDHGIEREGKIKIELARAPKTDGISLKISDDGRGIDLEKVRRKAVEKNLIAGESDLSEAEILNLIFAHGFSTGETVSEISGRGVGLDVVKDLTEKAGGEISVKSESGKGTTFEILLKEK
ncbi:MAG TPA: ATP-binding protein [Pyrinomonadaceae bacterium]|jgi:chemotaxis protein histidine kinase CheA